MIWRHKKRGTTYQHIGAAEMQCDGAIVEGDVVEVYRGEDGKLWARPSDEFYDGRFEAVMPSPEPTE